MTKLREKIMDECHRHRPFCNDGENVCFMYLYNISVCMPASYEQLKRRINVECAKRPRCVNGCDICPVYDSLICLEMTE